jgi:hypothetical protein
MPLAGKAAPASRASTPSSTGRRASTAAPARTRQASEPPSPEARPPGQGPRPPPPGGGSPRGASPPHRALVGPLGGWGAGRPPGPRRLPATPSRSRRRAADRQVVPRMPPGATGWHQRLTGRSTARRAPPGHSSSWNGPRGTPSACGWAATPAVRVDRRAGVAGGWPPVVSLGTVKSLSVGSENSLTLLTEEGGT